MYYFNLISVFSYIHCLWHYYNVVVVGLSMLECMKMGILLHSCF